jgi:hypothetical protein
MHGSVGRGILALVVARTPEAERMQAVVAEHAPMLKAAGFRKRRHCFNRPVDDGLVHVVFFWMAPKEPPAWTEVPGLRERLYGSFRLDFGVYVPEMTRNGVPRGSWINDHDCQLRRTIGYLMTGDDRTDLWWRLDDPAAAAVAGEALARYGLPWLHRFPGHQPILDAFDRAGPFPLGLSPAGALDIADLCRAKGLTRRERRILEDYVGEPKFKGHAEYLAGYLTSQGHADLAAIITTQE